jgi:RNA polymerase sigma factor (TIGR02999 family)
MTAIPSPEGEITRWLTAWRSGESEAMDRLMPLVGDTLHQMASRQLQRESPGHTLSPTALVHEAWLRIADHQQVTYQDRLHFLAVASRVMRRVLIDHARRARAAKRSPLSTIDTVALTTPTDDWVVTLIALDSALDQLAQIEARLARVVECRFFGGLTEDETAAVLDISARTVHRDWLRARAWLEIALRD